MTEEGGIKPYHQVMPQALGAADGTGSLIIRRYGCWVNRSLKLSIYTLGSCSTKCLTNDKARNPRVFNWEPVFEDACKGILLSSYKVFTSSHISDTENELLYLKLQRLWWMTAGKLVNWSWMPLHTMNERRCHRAHALCLDVHRVLVRQHSFACEAPCSLLPLTPRRTVSRSTQVSAALHVHVAGIHMAHSPICCLWFRIILPSDHEKDGDQCKPEKNMLTRQQERGVKEQTTSIVLFFSVLLTSDTEQIGEYRVRFGAAWRLPSLDDFTHYWQRIQHRFMALVDPVRTKSD